jgi:Flp pilus assembly protein TadB
MAVPLLAIAALQVGMAMMQNQSQMKAARRARQAAANDALKNQNEQVDDAFRRRRQSQGSDETILGGLNPSQIQDGQTSLTQNSNTKQSLLGG